MSKIMDEIIRNPKLLENYNRKPRHNLIKVQTVTGSKYLGYIKDCDEDGIWFEPLFKDLYPAYIFKRDINKIIIPTNPDEEIEALKRQKSWFAGTE